MIYHSPLGPLSLVADESGLRGAWSVSYTHLERDIDISRAERAKLRAEQEIEEAHDKHLIDQERRAKIALQRAINRINVGSK